MSTSMYLSLSPTLTPYRTGKHSASVKRATNEASLVKLLLYQ